MNVSGKKQLLDRQLLRMVAIHTERPNASRVLIARAAGPMAADPAALPWRKLPASIRRRP